MIQFCKLIIIFIVFAKAHATSIYLKRSPRALLLGDAYTARATGDHSLYYNPALLGRHDGLTLFPFPLSFSGSFDIDDTDRFSDVSEEPAEIASQFMNYPVHLDMGITPGLKFGNFGLSFLFNLDANFLIYNQVHPFLEVDYRYDKGFVFGYAMNFGSEKSGLMSLGLGIKHIKREGLSDQYSLMGTEVLNALEDDSDLSNIARTLGLGEDKAWGFDIGIDYVKKFSGGDEFSTGLSIMDVARTDFIDESNPDSELADQEMLVNWGAAYTLGLKFADIIVSFDLHPLNLNYSFERMVHVGLELDLPSVDVFLGYNKAGFSYGAEMDFFFMRLIAGLYKSDVGVGEFTISSKRAVIYLSLLDFSTGNLLD